MTTRKSAPCGHQAPCGCLAAPCCIACPLPACLFDPSGRAADHARAKAERDTGIVRLRAMGIPIEAVARQFHVSGRVVYRALETHRKEAMA